MYNIGDIFESNNYGSFRITEYLGKNSSWVHMYRVVFIDTGYSTVTQRINIKLGKVKDKLKPVVCGVGYPGDGTFTATTVHKKIYMLWTDMIRRCYDERRRAYKFYGAKGVSVCDHWHNYTNFYNDLITLPGYDERLLMVGHLDLDKDKFQMDIELSSRIYSKETCCFISHKENTSADLTSPRYATIIVTYPNGTEEEVTGILPFAKRAGLDAGNISSCLSGTSKTAKGHKFRYSEEYKNG